jgi:hypothetical protein
MKATSTWAIALVLLCALAPIPARGAAPPASTAEIAALIAKLDNDRFTVRRRADEALRQYGQAILPVLRAHLASTTSVEVRLRLTAMIDDLSAEDRVRELVRQLGDKREEYRTSADWELRRYGKIIVPMLKKELAAIPSAPQRKQVERLIADLGGRR